MIGEANTKQWWHVQKRYVITAQVEIVACINAPFECPS